MNLQLLVIYGLTFCGKERNGHQIIVFIIIIITTTVIALIHE
jgi:hypothetical protein